MSATPQWLRQAACERAGGHCEAMIPLVRPRCRWTGTDVHHRKKRSAGGAHELDNALWVCRNCHTWLEAHPGWSFERGLLVHGWQDVSWPPAYYRGVLTPRKEET